MFRVLRVFKVVFFFFWIFGFRAFRVGVFRVWFFGV